MNELANELIEMGALGVPVNLPEVPPKARKNSPEYEATDMRLNHSPEARQRGLSAIDAIRARISGEQPQPPTPAVNKLGLKLGLMSQLDGDLVQRVARTVAA